MPVNIHLKVYIFKTNLVPFIAGIRNGCNRFDRFVFIADNFDRVRCFCVPVSGICCFLPRNNRTRRNNKNQ